MPMGSFPGRLTLAALALVASRAHAQSPLPSTARVGEVAAVTPEPSPVVMIRGGSFAMGTDTAGLDEARTQCLDELDRFVAFRGGERSDGVVLHGFRRQLVGCGLDAFARVICAEGFFGHEAITHEVWLPSFGIDRTEVTVGAYDRCVRAGACAPPLDPPGTPQTGIPTLPVTGVRWDDARDYCRHAGGRLPTEAEWERAARGRDGRTFPWGWVLDGRRFNHGAAVPDCHDADDGFALAAPVGSFPDGASPEGVLDLAGNVMEWVTDRAPVDADGRFMGHPVGRAVDPQGAREGSERVVRGGSFELPMFAGRNTARMRRLPGVRARDLGFRCAYDRP